MAFDPAAARRVSTGKPWRRCRRRAGHAATALLGHMYVLGGGWQRPLDDNARYDVAADSWSTLPSPLQVSGARLGNEYRYQLGPVCLYVWRVAWCLSGGCSASGPSTALSALTEVMSWQATRSVFRRYGLKD